MTNPLVPYYEADFLEQLNRKLQSLAKAAIEAAPGNLKAKTYGIFSLDDLEQQMTNQPVGMIGLGVSYNSATRGDPIVVVGNAQHKDGGGRADLHLHYLIVVAVATNDCCDGKFDGLNLLHVLRMGILGRPTLDDADPQKPRPSNIISHRATLYPTWDFVKEGPETGASSDAMLYYSQVWRASVPVTGFKPK